LALAYKNLDKNIAHTSISRPDAEKDLIFGGFFVLGSQLKPDTKKVIK
jgi:magnesium-transporting ATPase (P-type)